MDRKRLVFKYFQFGCFLVDLILHEKSVQVANAILYLLCSYFFPIYGVGNIEILDIGL